MKSWKIDRLGGKLSFVDVPIPEVRPGSVLVRVQSQALMSYLKPYVEGKLPAYRAPEDFTPGGNAIGTVEAVGADVWHLKKGQRVVTSSYLVARENVAPPSLIPSTQAQHRATWHCKHASLVGSRMEWEASTGSGR